MCGIIALLTEKGPVTREPLEAGLRAMRHRGPDSRGLWIDPEHRVGLGHARLSIIDLEGGAQPLGNEDGTLQAVVNGEFYDFERIRSELEARGHRFRTWSDSEILVHLYEEYGTDCVEYLRGEFAFVLWDSRLRRLFAGRDRFGIKPLCYTERNGSLYLASEAKALFAAGVPARWDSESFYQSALAQYVLPDRTLFQDVRQLPPGHTLLWERGVLRVDRYWDLPAAATMAEVSEGECVERLRDVLEEAIRLRLRADVPVACHLSGGLDSSSVLGLAARFSPRPVDAFTVSFEASSYDELSIAEETARKTGARLQVVRVTQDDLVDCLPRAVAYSEGFAINGHLPAKFLLSRAIREAGYKVVLTGEGSDEVLAGYAHLRRDLLLERQGGDGEDALAQLAATNQVSAGIMMPQGEALSLEAVRARLGFVPSFLEAKATYGYRMRSMLAPELLRAYADRDVYVRLMRALEVPARVAGRGRVDQSLYLWNKTALANYILRTLGDGTEMAHSVEGRVPFLDHHLAEVALSLPLDVKIRGRVEKWVLREAARPDLTETVYRREKHPFLAPPLSCFGTRRAEELLQDQLRSPSARVPFLDHGRLLGWLDRLPSLSAGERAAADPVLMTALCAGILQEQLGLSLT